MGDHIVTVVALTLYVTIIAILIAILLAT